MSAMRRAHEDGEGSYVEETKKANDAKEKFDDELSKRRKTWVFDWVIPLIELERDQMETAFDFRSHISVSKIRAKLHELQFKMVCIFLSC